MNTVWVYGCSFSEPFQLESGGPEWDHQGDRIIKADYWGTHLAKRLGLNLVTRSSSGIGLNHIMDQIAGTWHRWHSDDIVVISPSFFSRVTMPEFIDISVSEHNAHLFRSWDQISQYNQQRWHNYIRLYQTQCRRLYTWCVDDPSSTAGLQLITAPGDLVNWKHWMDQHPEYWQSLPGVVYPLGDWHFNAAGHSAVAERMAEVICPTQQ
jgi:hypothetical protein